MSKCINHKEDCDNANICPCLFYKNQNELGAEVMIEDTKTYNGHTYNSQIELSACINGYKQGRADAIDEFFKAITEHTIVCTDGVTEVVDVMDIIKCKEQLKEQKNE